MTTPLPTDNYTALAPCIASLSNAIVDSRTSWSDAACTTPTALLERQASLLGAVLLPMWPMLGGLRGAQLCAFWSMEMTDDGGKFVRTVHDAICPARVGAEMCQRLGPPRQLRAGFRPAAANASVPMSFDLHPFGILLARLLAPGGIYARDGAASLVAQIAELWVDAEVVHGTVWSAGLGCNKILVGHILVACAPSKACLIGEGVGRLGRLGEGPPCGGWFRGDERSRHALSQSACRAAHAQVCARLVRARAVGQ